MSGERRATKRRSTAPEPPKIQITALEEEEHRPEARAIPEEAPPQASETSGDNAPEESNDDETPSALSISPELRTALKVTDEQLQEFREIFCLVDQDGGGTISTDELEVLMRTLGLRATQSELDQIVSEIDSGNTGEIGFEAFVSAMARKVNIGVPRDTLLKAFEAYADIPGGMTVARLFDILVSEGDPMKRISRDEAEEVLMQVIGTNVESHVFDYSLFLRTFFDEQ